MTHLVGPDGHLLTIVAHPDDESFGCGSVIAHAVVHGARVSVCSATLGEAGELAPGAALDGRTLSELRHDELRAAAAHLGATCLPPLGLLDSGWDGEPPAGSLCDLPWDALVTLLCGLLDEHRPDAVLVLAGDDGHRDHVRIRDGVLAAVDERAALPVYASCLSNELMRRWAEQMRTLRPDTAYLTVAELGTRAQDITHVLDTGAQLAARRRAIAAHASQISPYDGLSPELAEAFLTADHLVQLR